jgi:hypothetical protein
MLEVIMNPAGAVHAQSVATTAALIERERAAGRYEPPLEAPTLAFILVQIGQAFMWARAATGADPDIDQTLRVTAELLRA